jgi:hypothetical protein
MDLSWNYAAESQAYDRCVPSIGCGCLYLWFLPESIVLDRKSLSLSSVWWLRILSRKGRSPSQSIPMINPVDYISCRMLKLQDVKVGMWRLEFFTWHDRSDRTTGLAEAALGEGTGAKLHKLSVKDIKYVRLKSVVRLPVVSEFSRLLAAFRNGARKGRCSQKSNNSSYWIKVVQSDLSRVGHPRCIIMELGFLRLCLYWRNFFWFNFFDYTLFQLTASELIIISMFRSNYCT